MQCCGLLLFPVIKDVLLMMCFMSEYKACMHKLLPNSNTLEKQRQVCVSYDMYKGGLCMLWFVIVDKIQQLTPINGCNYFLQ